MSEVAAVPLCPASERCREDTPGVVMLEENTLALVVNVCPLQLLFLHLILCMSAALIIDRMGIFSGHSLCR
jgi:hypothetical protein